MSKTKNLLLTLCIIISGMLVFSGCSTITSLNTVYLDGSRSYVCQITVDEPFCTTNNINPTAVMLKIQETAQDYQNRLLAYATLNGRNTEGVEYKHGLSPQNPYLYEIQLSFDSFQTYCNFYGITQDDLQNQTTEYNEKLFTTEIIVQDSEILTPQDLLTTCGIALDYDSLKNSFLTDVFAGDTAKCDLFLSHTNLNIIRCYPTASNFRSNADQTTTAVLPNGVKGDKNTTYKAFLWQCTLNNPTPHIYVYQTAFTALNRTMWYLLAFGLTLIFGIILTIILIIKSKQSAETTPNDATNQNDTISPNNNIMQNPTTTNTNTTQNNNKTSNDTITQNTNSTQNTNITLNTQTKNKPNP